MKGSDEGIERMRMLQRHQEIEKEAGMTMKKWEEKKYLVEVLAPGKVLVKWRHVKEAPDVIIVHAGRHQKRPVHKLPVLQGHVPV